jgi:hypothetical protein
VRLSIALCALALAACQGQTSTSPPIVPIRNMHEQPRFDPQAESDYFDDGRTMRPPVSVREGDLEIPATVAREMEVDLPIDTGIADDGSYLMTIPEPVIVRAGGLEPLIERGQERYGIYCVPCHGGLGDGEGLVPIVSGEANIRPPTFHDDRIRHMPDGQMYATIRNGVRNMPSYRGQVPVQDRWAIVSYVRALQLTQGDGRTAQLEGVPR